MYIPIPKSDMYWPCLLSQQSYQIKANYRDRLLLQKIELHSGILSSFVSYCHRPRLSVVGCDENNSRFLEIQILFVWPCREQESLFRERPIGCARVPRGVQKKRGRVKKRKKECCPASGAFFCSWGRTTV